MIFLSTVSLGAGAARRTLSILALSLLAGGLDLVAEAQRGTDSGEMDRIHDILLASAGIPGAFPFRIIDETFMLTAA